MKNLKQTLSAIAVIAVITGVAYAFNTTNFIDNLNEQDIKLYGTQETLSESNEPIREEIKAIEVEIAELEKEIVELKEEKQENSNKWHKIQGQRNQIKEMIRAIEDEVGK